MRGKDVEVVMSPADCCRDVGKAVHAHVAKTSYAQTGYFQTLHKADLPRDAISRVKMDTSSSGKFLQSCKVPAQHPTLLGHCKTRW